jgi:hypothetical protein
MFEVTIFIPTADNDGKAFDAAHHAAFEAATVERFGGLTRYQNGAHGVWTDGNKTYVDANIIYGVAVASLTDGDKVRDLVSIAKSHYRQEAIFIKYLGIAEIL